MGRRSITGGVIPANGRRIQFDFAIEGVRYRPTLRSDPTEANLRHAREHLRRIKPVSLLAHSILPTSFPILAGCISSRCH